MTAETAKDLVHRRLKNAREALVWKLDGLSEYDARRPMTATGTNLLGLVKHLGAMGGPLLRRGLRAALPGAAAPLAGL